MCINKPHTPTLIESSLRLLRQQAQISLADRRALIDGANLTRVQLIKVRTWLPRVELDASLRDGVKYRCGGRHFGERRNIGHVDETLLRNDAIETDPA